MMKIAAATTMLGLAAAAPVNRKFNEVWSLDEEVRQGINRAGNWEVPRPQVCILGEDHVSPLLAHVRDQPSRPYHPAKNSSLS